MRLAAIRLQLLFQRTQLFNNTDLSAYIEGFLTSFLVKTNDEKVIKLCIACY
jgi:hypothetical protein